jgi:aminomethyltransferase
LAKKTSLYEKHKEWGGKLIDFGGWELPVQYEGIKKEHQAVREKKGLFDVSHMGEFRVEGEGAEDFLNHLLTNNVSKVRVGQAQYQLLCREDGGVLDDLLIYRRGDHLFLMVVNAANEEKDFDWVKKQAGKATWKGKVEVSNESSKWSLLAVQGPEARELVQKISDEDLLSISSFRFKEVNLRGEKCLVSRTGYTGEDGFEIYCSWQGAIPIAEELMKASEGSLSLAGLGARDTLRTEAKLPLYGHELDENINPFEADLSWVVKLKKTDFIGKEALEKIKSVGIKRISIGFEMVGRGIARDGYPIIDGSGEKIGIVTTGTHSPTLKKAIGIGMVALEYSKPGSRIFVDIRGKQIEAKIVETPFVQKK